MVPKSDIGPAEREWLEEMVVSWTEVYKKSATTLVLLKIIKGHGPASIGKIQELFTAQTGWDITERGLYRTLKRLEDAGLLAVEGKKVPRTGAKRKDFSLTAAGDYYLQRITEVSQKI